MDVLAAGKAKGKTFRTAVHVHEEGAPLTYTEYRGYDIKSTTSDAAALRVQYGVVFITGGRSPEQARNLPNIMSIVQQALSREIVVAAICRGPELLIAAGVTNTAMSGSTLIQDVIEKSGNTFEKGRVVVAERSNRATIITAPPTHIGVMIKYVVDTDATSRVVPASEINWSYRPALITVLMLAVLFVIKKGTCENRRISP